MPPEIAALVDKPVLLIAILFVGALIGIYVEKFVAWSFIKFIAGLGAILVAHQFAKLLMGDTSVGWRHFLRETGFIGIAFAAAATEVWLSETLPRLWFQHKGSLRPLVNIHEFFTRHRRGD